MYGRKEFLKRVEKSYLESIQIDQYTPMFPQMMTLSWSGGEMKHSYSQFSFLERVVLEKGQIWEEQYNLVVGMTRGASVLEPRARTLGFGPR